MVRVNRSARRPRRPVRTRQIIRRIENSDIGCEFRPSFDPPAWASAPWWPFTVVLSHSVDSSVSATTLHAAVMVALNLDGFNNSSKQSVSFNLRLLTVRVWGLNKQPITLGIRTGNSAGPIKLLNDRGSPIHYSKLAWRFGRASFAMLDSESSNDKTVLYTVGGASAEGKVLSYVQMLIQRTDIKNAKVLEFPTEQTSVNELANEFEMLN